MREAFSKVYLWTDSKIVLNYSCNENKNFGVYVTHRVNENRNKTNVEDWHYVQSKSNVADDAIRCRSFSDLNSGLMVQNLFMKVLLQNQNDVMFIEQIKIT